MDSAGVTHLRFHLTKHLAFALWLSHLTLIRMIFFSSWVFSHLFYYPLHTLLIHSKLLAINVLQWPTSLGYMTSIWCFKIPWKEGLSHLFILFVYLSFLGFFWENKTKQTQSQGVRKIFSLNHNVTSICCRGQDQSKVKSLKSSLFWYGIHNLALTSKRILGKKKNQGWCGTIICQVWKDKSLENSACSTPEVKNNLAGRVQSSALPLLLWNFAFMRETEEIMTLWSIADTLCFGVFVFSAWPNEKASSEFFPWCFRVGSSQLRIFTKTPLTNGRVSCSINTQLIKLLCPVFSMQKGCTSAIVCTWALCDLGNKQATHEPATQNTKGLCSQFLATEKESAPDMPVHTPQLSSKGVMSHILGPRDNFFLIKGYLYYLVFSSSASQGQSRSPEQLPKQH